MQVRRRRYDRTVLAPGQTVRGQDSYQVGEPIGEGGYAVVYAATSSAGLPVALKEFLLGMTVAEREQMREMFARERQVLWGLRLHPHLPDLIEAFSQDGLHYLALELVPGQTLRERLSDEGPVSPKEAGPLSLQLTRAVAALHSHGIVHHDVKPENVKFSPTGLAILLDFGSARSVAATREGLRAVLWGRDGYALGAGPGTQIAGTPGYMAPELREMVNSDCIVSDYRLDVFALGCTMYEVITGNRLAQSEIDARNERRVEEAVEEVRALCPGLAGPVARALRLGGEERYPSARDLLGDLEQLVPPRPTVRKQLLEFDAASGRVDVEQALVITNAGGGMLSGWVRSRHAGISFLRPDGSRVRELHFDGNLTAVRVAADVSCGMEDTEETGQIRVETELGDLEVTCRVVRSVGEYGSLLVTPPRITLSVTPETMQQTVVKVRHQTARAGRIRAQVSPQGMLEVVPWAAEVTPGRELQFRVLPVIAALRPGLHRMTVSFQAEPGEARASLSVTLDVRGAGLWGRVRRFFRRKA